MKILFIVLFAFSLGFTQDEKPTIIKKPLAEKCSRTRTKADNVTHIMLHFCSYAIENPENPYQLSKIIEVFESMQVSANYIIDREGKIYELVNENRVAYHAGKGKLQSPPHYENSMNGHAIGIEIMGIGTEKEMEMFMSKSAFQRIDKKNIGFTTEQYAATNLLINDIASRYPAIKKNRKHIVGHDEYAPTRRTDPGSLFDWAKIGL